MHTRIRYSICLKKGNDEIIEDNEIRDIEVGWNLEMQLYVVQGDENEAEHDCRQDPRIVVVRLLQTA